MTKAEPSADRGQALIPLLIDCDPGIDDAVALMLATAASDHFRLLGVTTVFGNASVERTTTNAQRILELCGATGVPVAMGCPRPMLRPLIDAKFIHGASGLGRLVLPDPRTSPDLRDGVDFIIDTIRHATEPVTLVAVGPLTNLAVAIVKDFQTMSRLERIVMMGGALRELGNMENTAGFNTYADPHAAAIVLRSGIEIVQCIIDATHNIQTTQAEIQRMQKIGTRCADAIAVMFDEHSSKDAHIDLDPDAPVGGCMHDACCIAYLMEPQMFSGRRVNVQVEIASEVSMGRHIIDWWGRSKRSPNSYVLHKVERKPFFDLLATYLAKLP
jgi:purine nucleosidase